MNFQAFEQSIVSPALKHVAAHWNEVRGSRAMPSWSDIRPLHIKAELPLTWSYKYDKTADALIGRLAGDQIEKVFRKTFRGTPMSALYPADTYPHMFARFRRVVCEPALYRGEGMIFKCVDHYGHGERIVLPLSGDGVLGDGILGATKYNSIRGHPGIEHPESEAWFAL